MENSNACSRHDTHMTWFWNVRIRTPSVSYATNVLRFWAIQHLLFTSRDDGDRVACNSACGLLVDCRGHSDRILGTTVGEHVQLNSRPIDPLHYPNPCGLFAIVLIVSGALILRACSIHSFGLVSIRVERTIEKLATRDYGEYTNAILTIPTSSFTATNHLAIYGTLAIRRASGIGSGTTSPIMHRRLSAGFAFGVFICIELTPSHPYYYTRTMHT